MVKRMMVLFTVITILGSIGPLQAGPQDSILAIRQPEPGKITKARGYAENVRTQAQGLESMQHRGFTILLNSLRDGTYEVQAFRMVTHGTRRVNSIFSSLYKSSVEFGYRFDGSSKKIVRHHFLFPPNSLTGWANPGDYSMMDQFDWGEPFPSRSCYTITPVHTSEESGREYLEATCLPDRETAVRFAVKFIDYMRGSRGL